MRHAIVPILALVAAASLAAACNNPEPVAVSRAIVVLTDSDTYVATATPDTLPSPRYRFSVIGSVENVGTATVYLARCFPGAPTPQVSLDAGAAYAAPFAPVACSGHAQHIALAPGEVRVDTIPFVGPYMWQGGTGAPLGALEGAFRLNYRVYPCATCIASALSYESTRSTPFEVHLPQ